MRRHISKFRRGPCQKSDKDAIIIQPTPSFVEGIRVTGITGRISGQGTKITQTRIVESTLDATAYIEIADDYGYDDVMTLLSEETHGPDLQRLACYREDSTYTIIDVLDEFGNNYRHVLVNMLHPSGFIFHPVQVVLFPSVPVGTYDIEFGPKIVQELAHFQPSLWPRNLKSMADRVLQNIRFLSLHTEPPTAANFTATTNTECSICLGDAETHVCIKIKNVSGCEHMVGKSCLEEMLCDDIYNKKSCPLCRAEFLGEICESDTGELEEALVQWAIGARGTRRSTRLFRRLWRRKLRGS